MSAQYWPYNRGEEITFGSAKVTLQLTNHQEDYIHRQLRVIYTPVSISPFPIPAFFYLDFHTRFTCILLSQSLILILISRETHRLILELFITLVSLVGRGVEPLQMDQV